MRSLLLLALAPAAASASWVEFRSGPFEVFSDAGGRVGRETMVRFEEFRHALGRTIGIDDISTPEPIRIVVFNSAKARAAWAAPDGVIRGRGRYYILQPGAAPFAELTKLFLETASERMPPHIERGLIALFSTLEVSGIRISLGAPPPAAQRDLDWARVHLLATSTEYYGKLRVLLGNLRKGVDEGPAYRNSLQKPREEIEKEARAHLAAGKFEPASVPARPLSVDRDFPERPVSDSASRLALADILAGEKSRALYQQMLQEKLNVAECYEGLGLLALREKHPEAARENFARAVEAGAQTADVHLQYARLETDPAKAAGALKKAIAINPKLAEPHYLLSKLETEPGRKLQQLQLAAQLDRRNAGYWAELARMHLSLHQFGEAAKAWRGAELAAVTTEERARTREARLSIEQQRLDYEEAERRRIALENEREIRKLKEQAIAEVRSLEQRYSKDKTPSDEKVVPWWEGPKPDGRAAGTLKQIDCLGRQARLVITTEDGKQVRLLITDPGQIAIAGGGEKDLSCGPQKARRVVVEYFRKPNSKLSTAGEVATIEFP